MCIVAQVGLFFFLISRVWMVEATFHHNAKISSLTLYHNSVVQLELTKLVNVRSVLL